MNNIFYFMEICDLVNYADDNTLSVIERTVQMVLSALKKDAENDMNWFKDNFMQANPEKNPIYVFKEIYKERNCPQIH